VAVFSAVEASSAIEEALDPRRGRHYFVFGAIAELFSGAVARPSGKRRER
jgi:hypothetical protein